MKYFRDGKLVIEGTPEEIAEYHRRMAGGRSPSSAKYTKRIVRGGYRRAHYKPEETRAILSSVKKGKSPKQIANYLWKNHLSPHKRTPAAIRTYINRNLVNSLQSTTTI